MFFHNLYEKTPAYFEQVSYRLTGDLRVEIAEKSLNELVKRHDILRTVFIQKGSEKALQVVLKERNIEFHFQNIESISDSDSFLEAYREKDKMRGFDLAKDVLMRAAIFKISKNEYEFIWSHHHIVMDGWCRVILVEEYLHLYNCLIENRLLNLPPAVPFRNYVLWLEEQEIDEAKDYWENYLAGYDHTVGVPPTNLTRPGIASLFHHNVIFEVGKERKSKLEEIAIRHKVTLNTIIQTVWGILLGKYNNVHDIVFGAVVSGRPSEIEGVESMVGLFVNTIPVRIKYEKDVRFDALILQVQEEAIQCKPYHYCPLATIQSHSEVKRKLINHFIAFENYPVAAQIEGLIGSKTLAYTAHSNDMFSQSNYAFSVLITLSDGLVTTFEFDTTMYQVEFVNKLKDHFLQIIDQIIENPAISINKISLLTTSERDQILDRFNSTKSYYPVDKGIHDLFETQALKTPDAISVVYEDRCLTYKELNERSNQLAHYLRNHLGVKEEDLVGVVVNRTDHMILALLSILKAGAAYVPIDPNYPADRISYIVKDTGLNIVLTDAANIDLCDNLQWDIESFKTYLCIDREIKHEGYQPAEQASKQLWDYVAKEGTNAYTSSGWVSSYTNEAFGQDDMREFVNNVLVKLKPYLHSGLRVLEVGCGSGIIMFEVAPYVKTYTGTDISEEVLKKCGERINAEGISNVELYCLTANEIDELKSQFDLIIVNSVVQYFPSYQYGRDFLDKAISMLTEEGILFIGDIRDKALQYDYYASLFKSLSQVESEREIIKKSQRENELFVHKDFFGDYFGHCGFTCNISFLDKIGSIKNELSLYRYDALVNVSKRVKAIQQREPRKRQFRYEASSDSPKTQVKINLHNNHLAYVIYTSGSTAQPKGVEITHQNAVAFLYWAMQEFQNSAFDIVYAVTSYCFDLSVYEIFYPLTIGKKLRVLDSGVEISDYLPRDTKVLINTVPSVIEALLHDQEDFTEVTVLNMAGEPIPSFVKDALDTTRIEVRNLYGPSEDTTYSSCYRFADRHAIIPIGKPIANTKFYIVDDDFNLQPPGILGEICISGAGLARGYWRKEEQTRERFIDNPFEPGTRLYKTGDMGRWLIDGNIEFAGRKDHQIKLRGYRIELGEIEHVLQQYAGIEKAAVLVKENTDKTKQLVAYVGSREELEIAHVKEYLEKLLPSYMVPYHIIRINEFPLTPNGKIDRKALPHPEEFISGQSTAYEGPKNPIEEQLVEIWKKVLGRERVGIKSNFFELGGDSIKAIQISSRMYKAGYKITIKNIFNYTTIEAIAPTVTSLNNLLDQSDVTGEIPLTPIQKEFFASTRLNKHHYNQALKISFKKRTGVNAIKKVFSKILQHHDALRMTFRLENENVSQFNQPTVNQVIVEEYHVDHSLQNKDELAIRVDAIQKGIDLEKGPLMKLALFHLSDGDHLLIVVHHLVIDAVSWRILLEDLQTLLLQYDTGLQLSLPLKTDSFKTWSEKLAEYANSERCLEEKSYWKAILNRPVEWIKKDFEVEENLMGDSTTHTVEISKDETEKLCTKTNKAFNTEVNDILLVALGIGLKNTFGIEQILIAMEGHGREEVVGDININRTMGWFTSVYPILLKCSRQHDWRRQIKEVKESLRRIPKKGIGYGLLKYLTDEKYIQDTNFEIHPDISFNYFGQFDTIISEAPFSVTTDSTGSLSASSDERLYLLDISAIIADGQLSLSITYNKKHFKEETITTFFKGYADALSTLISQCASVDATTLTPSDLTFKDLSIDVLDELNKDGKLEDVYPLSPMQEGMLFHHLYNKQSVTNFNQLSYRINAALDILLVEKSFNDIIKRYSVLRTAFAHAFTLQPLQIVYKERKIDFRYEDISTIADTESYVVSFKEADKIRNFDLEKDVLMRITVLRVGSKEYEFIWSFHHILLDGWCISILIKEFLHFYNSYFKQQPPSLPPVQPYKTYIQWLASQDKRAAHDYWKVYLDDFNTVTKMPTWLPATDSNEYRHAEFEFIIDQARTEQLKQLAIKFKVTLNTLFQTLWSLLLAKYNNSEDVVFGAVVSGRPYEISGAESMIGLFINTLPVRVKYNQQTRFDELLQGVQKKAKESELFQYYPLAEIQALSNIKQNLFDHILIYENYPLAEQIEGLGDESENEVLELTTSRVELVDQTSYNLNVVIIPGSTVSIKLKYNEDAFDVSAPTRIATHFQQIIDCILQSELKTTGEIYLLGEAEKQKLLVDFNNTKVAFPKERAIHELVEQQVSKTPDAIAIVFEDKQLSYQELNERSNRLAHYLRSQHGIRPNDLVGLMVNRSDQMVIGLLAILKASAGYVAVDPNYPEARIKHVLNDSGAKLVLTQKNLTQYLNSNQEYFLIEDEDQLVSYPSGNPVLLNQDADLAYLIYTSGSTGIPKGIEIAHRNAVSFLHWSHSEFRHSRFDIAYAVTSYCFDLSVFEIFYPLTIGKPVRVISSGLAIKDYIDKDENILVNTVPSVIEALLKEKTDFSRVTVLNMAGEPISKFVKEHLDYHKTEVRNLYGPSEDTTYSSCYRFADDHDIIPIGKPISNTRFYIVDDQLQLLPEGITGELYIAGEGLGRGYYRQPNLTAEKFLNNPFSAGEQIYRTGDLARWLPDGNVEYMGRKDNQIKLRGYRIELGEIENALERFTGITKSIAIVKHDSVNEKHLLAYYTKNTNDIDTIALRKHLGTYLPVYMVPAHLVEIETFPLTTNGKIDRDALVKSSDAFISSSRDYLAPSGLIEETLVSIWATVLGKEKIGVKDNFFEIGGHSLKAMQVVSLLRKELNIKITIKDVFTLPSITELSALIREKEKEVYEEITPVEIQEYYEVSHAQKRLWISSQFEGSQLAYNIPGVYIIDGPLDKAAFDWSFMSIVRRHESLRTTFITVDGVPKQEIQSPDNYVFRVDYDNLIADPQREERAKQLAEGEATTPFALSQGPLLRVRLIQMEGQKHILLLTMHHIISDGWSMEVLQHEFIEHYKAFKEGRQYEKIDPLKIQYKDYAAWHKKLLSGEFIKKSKIYWLEQFKGELPVLNLPTDFPRPAVKTFEGETLDVKWSKSVLDSLNDFSQSKGVSLFMTLHALIKALLYRYTEQEDIVVGFVETGRDHHTLENQIGYYINTVALRTRFKGTGSFDELLLEVRNNTLNAFEHIQYPFDLLVDELQVERKRSRNPLFDVLMSVQNVEVRKNINDALPGLSVTPFAANVAVSKFDLTVAFTPLDSGMLIHAEFSKELFKTETIKRFVDHLHGLAKAAIADSSMPINRLDYFSAAERSSLIYGYNDTVSEFPQHKTLNEIFEQVALAQPEKNAVVYRNTRISYRELNERSNRLAHYLREKYDVRPDEIIGIMAARSERMIIAMMGILKSGAAYLPIDPDYPAERKSHILSNGNVRVVLTELHHMLDVSDYTGALFELDVQVDSLDTSIENPVTQHRSDNLGYVIYTSGSTGQPKGVMIEQRGAINMILNQIERFGIKSPDHVGWFSSFSFDASVSEIFMALYTGASLVVLDKSIIENPEKLVKYLAEEQVSVITFPPAYLANLDKASIDFLRVIITAGEPARVDDAVICSRFCRYFNAYGPTESSVCASTYEVTAQDSNLLTIPIGKPISNTQLYILDSFGEIVPIGVEGEIFIGGVGLARGYVNNKTLTDERFVYHPTIKGPLYRTGDTGKRLADGNIEYVGRKDTQIKIRGYRIELSEILSVIHHHPGVRDAYILPQTSNNTIQSLVAFVTPDPAYAPWVYRISRYIADHPYGLPSLYNLPNGFSVFNMNKAETEAVYKEVFEDHCYTRHAYKLSPGDVVFDIGANIGMFSLYMEMHCPGVKVYAFEPIEELYDTLIKNGALYGIDLVASKVGISNEETESEFTYYPYNTALSGRYGDPEKDQATLLEALKNQYQSENLTDEELEELLKDRLQAKQVKCELQTLSSVIKSYGVEKIDLLKVDAEKSEMDVLQGIDDSDWTKIQQIVLEVHNGDNRLSDIENILTNHGFTIVTEQLDELEGTILYHVYGTKLDEANLSKSFNTKDYHLNTAITSQDLLSSVKRLCADSLPSYMVPSSFQVIHELPLTSHGKVDRNALAEIVEAGQAAKTIVKPRNTIEEHLLLIWQKVLEKEEISIFDNFFELGGHSLKGMLAVSRIHKDLHYKIELKDLFSYPTIDGLCSLIKDKEHQEYQEIIPVDKQEYYDVSHGQKRLWILDQYGESKLAYTIPAAFILTGKLKRKAFEKAFEALINRHEILRTTFVKIQGDLKQKINSLEKSGFVLQYIDLQSEMIGDDEINEMLDDESKVIFDLEKGPLIYAKLLQLDEERYLFVLNMHHIISDGWSKEIIVKDILTLYGAYHMDRENPLQPLRIQYKDYTIWQNKQLEGQDCIKHKIYWLKKLGGDIQVLRLPIDYDRPPLKTYFGNSISTTIDSELTSNLKAISFRHESSLFMTILALVKVLLNRYSGNEDIVIGSPIAGRFHPDLENQIGLYLNTLVLRTQLYGEDTFPDVLEKVKATTLGAYEHQIYPFDRLVEDLNQGINLSRAPLFDVMVILQNTPDQSPEENFLNGVSVKECNLKSTTSKYDILFNFVEVDTELLMTIEYSTDLFKLETIIGIQNNLIRLIKAVTADTLIRISDIDIQYSVEEEKELDSFLRAMESI